MLFSIIYAFDYVVAQNEAFDDLTAGDTLTFDLVKDDGSAAPETIENFNVFLFEGSGDLSSKDPILQLGDDLTTPQDISVALPQDLEGDYFIGVGDADGEQNYSGLFTVAPNKDNASNDASTIETDQTFSHSVDEEAAEGEQEEGYDAYGSSAWLSTMPLAYLLTIH